jgi:hypothetical protein
MAMDLAMMASAQRHGELVTDLAPQRPLLRKAKMVGIRRLPAANQAGPLGDISDVTPNLSGARSFAGVRRRGAL